MLNPFPIQFLALIAYTLVRVFLGIVLLNLGITHVRNRKVVSKSFRLPLLTESPFVVTLLGLTEILLGTLFTLGFMTQYAALGTIFLSILVLLLYRRIASPYIPQKLSWGFILITSCSLFITGAGIFAFDLPL